MKNCLQNIVADAFFPLSLKGFQSIPWFWILMKRLFIVGWTIMNLMT